MRTFLLVAYLFVLLFGAWLSYLNIRHMRAKASTIPPGFESILDESLAERIGAYTAERSLLGTAESMLRGLVLLFFLFGGLLDPYDRWISGITGSFVLNGVLFFLVLTWAGMLLDVPFSIYRNFGIEARYGFNVMTPHLWLSDLLKSLAITSIIGAVAILAGLVIVQASPQGWWFWGWSFFFLFSFFLMYLSPYVIEPLFFRFSSLEGGGLEERIRRIMARAGISVNRVFQVDASRRSRHSNAYFTGIGRTKRVVLFDTILRQMREDEIIAVVAHEAGHWKMGHILKRIATSEVLALIGMSLAYHLVSSELLPDLFGAKEASFYARMTMVMFLVPIVTFPLTPLLNALSRRDERQADRFASALTGRPEDLASALVKLSKENLSNLHPHPLYAWFNYSHPPVVERVGTLKISP